MAMAAACDVACFHRRSHPGSVCFGGSPKATIMERRCGRRAPRVSASVAVTAFSSTISPPPTPVQTAPTPTLYDVLGIPNTASQATIKAAYRRLARQYHPDAAAATAVTAPPTEEDGGVVAAPTLATKLEACTDKFLQIHSAYAALSDPQTRQRYDLELSLRSFAGSGYARPLSSSSSPAPSSYCSPRSPFSVGRGRSWETDQCWC